MRNIRPATLRDAWRVHRACDLLREARNLLRDSGAPLATDKVRRALKSAEGAERHAYHRLNRMEA